MQLHLVHLYPLVLNLYGDRGNIVTLVQRCRWRGIDLLVHEVGLGQDFPDVDVDLIFMGGDQDREQAVVISDLRKRLKRRIEWEIDAGVPLLAVCGSYQLLQKYYRPADGPDLEGLGIFGGYTVHPGHDTPRCVGNIVVETEYGTVVGFENHGGRTHLEEGAQPFGRVVKGFGNNGEDGAEGARIRNVFGTYVHGPLLPKNPEFADALLQLALHRRYGDRALSPLDDSLERQAQRAAMTRSIGRNH